MLRSRIFWRLFGTYGLLLATALGLVGWLIQRRVEARQVEEMRRDLETKAHLVRQLVAQTDVPQNRSVLVQKLAATTGARVTLIAADGLVLADSAQDPARMDNHLSRPEVRQSEIAGVGIATRFSDTVQGSMMYVALRSDGGQARFVRLALPLDAVESESRWLQRVVWAAVGLTLLGALVISLILARRVSGPLVELAEAARAVAAGQYGTRVALASRDEVGTVAQAFNEMSLACAAHIEQMDQDRARLLAIFGSMVEGVLVLDADRQIQFFNDAVVRLLGMPRATPVGRKLWEIIRHRALLDLVESILAQAGPQHGELEVKSPEPLTLAVHGTRLPGNPARGAVLVFHDITHLRQLERVRRDFVANASHELKTPLAAIQATTETLQNGALGDPDHAGHFLERIRENAERLHRLVQDLLTLNRAESGTEEWSIGPVLLQEVVEARMRCAAPRAVAKNVELKCCAPAEPVTALADEEALTEILDNLLDNAIKYTPEGGLVTIRWIAKQETVVLAVEDTGIGIPAKDLDRIFERFYRVDRARSRALGGTGLGLSIVKHLAQALHGSVSAASEPGQGSVFTVRLPRSAAALTKA